LELTEEEQIKIIMKNNKRLTREEAIDIIEWQHSFGNLDKYVVRS